MELLSLEASKNNLGLALGDVVQWFRGYSGSTGLMVGFDNLKGIFQP